MMKSKGMLDLAPQFVDARKTGRRLLYRSEIEASLRTPGLRGRDVTLIDYRRSGTRRSDCWMISGRARGAITRSNGEIVAGRGAAFANGETHLCE